MRGNDASPLREAACQAYSPDTQIIFRIDCNSKSANDALPGVQIFFEQEGSHSHNHDMDDRGPFKGHRGDNLPSNSYGDQFRVNTDRFFSPEVRHQHDHNPWHHGHGSHSRFDNMSRALPINEQPFTNDQTFTNEQLFTSDQILNQDSMQWLSNNEVTDLRAARTPQEFLEKLFASFQPDHSTPSLLEQLSPRGLPTLTDLPTPPGLPSVSEISNLADKLTPPGLPTPGELFNPGDNGGGYTLPGATYVADFVDQLPTPPGLPTLHEATNVLDKITPKFLPKIGKLFGWG